MPYIFPRSEITTRSMRSVSTSACHSERGARNPPADRSSELRCQIARAGCCFEPARIDYPDVAAAVFEQPAALQLARCFGNAHPPHAEHMREKGLGQVNFVGLHPLTRHQQPAGETRLHDVKAVAGGSLRYLGHQRVR